MVKKILGAVAIMLGFVFYVLAIPTLNDSIQTGNNTALANETTTVKTIYSNYANAIALFGLIFLVLGAMAIVG